MYTLKLADVKITPSIISNKELSNANEMFLVKEAVALIEKESPGVYPNPVTLERKVSEAIKNAEGLTQQEVISKRQLAREEQSSTEKDILDKGYVPLEQSFMEKMKQLHIDRTEAIRAAGNIFDGALTAEERESIQLKRDDVMFEYKKKEDAILDQYKSERKDVRVTLNLDK